jgi:copper resistance protein C
VTRRISLPMIVLLGLALVAPAAGHSLLIAAHPAAGSAVRDASTLSLRFNNRVEKKLSQIRLVSAAGDGRTLPLRTDGALDTLEAPLPPLTPGHYRVEWRVLSTDGHVVSGSFAFDVSP